jgi:hypothetical protein
MEECQIEWAQQQYHSQGNVSREAQDWVKKQVYNNFRALQHQWKKLISDVDKIKQAERQSRRLRNKVLVRHAACAHACEERWR